MSNSLQSGAVSVQHGWVEHNLSQLSYFRSLNLRAKFEAVQGMADVVRRFEEMRAQGGFKSAPNESRSPTVSNEICESTTRYDSSGSVHEITLNACTPEPLMNYLKALGILRLIAEQVDPKARGFWRNDEFVLQASLEKDVLTEFLLTRYEPTPIFSPWNGDGGFLSDSGTSYETIGRIRKSRSNRLHKMQRVIDEIRSTASLQELGAKRTKVKQLRNRYNEKYNTKADKWKRKATDQEKEACSSLEKQIKSIKQNLIFRFRGEYPSESLSWLDACLVIGQDDVAMSPVLGSGGVDGRMEFSANYLSNVLEILEKDDSRAWLIKALFGAGSPALSRASIGQFAPGSVGGPNATQGMEGDSLVNPWNYVLMIEGVVLLAGTVGRRLGVNQSARAVFPFTVFSRAAGNSSLAQKEARDARGEIWLPLWQRPTRIEEIKRIYAEGRAELRGRQSYSAVDFARAIASLGVDRGIRSFSRQGFLKRNGLAFIATPLGRFDVQTRESVNLLSEIDGWLDRFRYACKVGQNGEAPVRLTSALRRIDNTIFDYCRYGDKDSKRFQSILAALGRAERELMRDGRWATRCYVAPLFGLSSNWNAAAWDDSPEFNLALALAGMRDSGGIGSLRTNLESARFGRRKDGELYASWVEKDKAVVWNAADLAANLVAVLTRRMRDACRSNEEHLPLWSSFNADLHAIATFVSGEIDHGRLEELLWGLVLVDQSDNARMHGSPNVRQVASPLTRLYALLKPLFLPTSIVCAAGHWRYTRPNENGIVIRPESRILPLLRAGRTAEAAQIAAQRLRSSGMIPMAIDHTESWGEVDGERLAGALLFPISSRSLNRLLRMVIRKESVAAELEGELV